MATKTSVQLVKHLKFFTAEFFRIRALLTLLAIANNLEYSKKFCKQQTACQHDNSICATN